MPPMHVYALVVLHTRRPRHADAYCLCKGGAQNALSKPVEQWATLHFGQPNHDIFETVCHHKVMNGWKRFLAIGWCDVIGLNVVIGGDRFAFQTGPPNGW